MKNLLTTLFLLFCTVLLHTPVNGQWNGTSDTTWYSPSASYFTLNNEAQLAGLAQIVNSGTDNFSGNKIILSADLNLNGAEQKWTPIGTLQNPFCGYLDGDGHLIAGMNISAVIADSDFVSYAYGLIGYGRDAKISGIHLVSDCKIYVNNPLSCLTQASVYIGGIIGCNSYASADSVFIKNCSSACEINTVSGNFLYMGGIVGYSDTPYIRFDSCKNTGKILGNKESDNGFNCNCFIGGIISTSPKSDFYYCTNTGNLTAYSYINGYAGGMFAQRSDYGFDTIYIKNCTNTGKIISNSYKYGSVSGGLIATIYPHNSHIEIANCQNSGDIGTYSFSSTGYCGGFIGFGNSVFMEKSINKGNISGKSVALDPEQAKLAQIYSGGLLGYSVNGDIIIKNCANTGNIAGYSDSHKDCVGGFAGAIENYFGPVISVSNSYNAGKIFTDTLNLASATIGFHPEVTPVYSSVYSIDNPLTCDSGLTWLPDNEGSDIPEDGYVQPETSEFMRTIEFVDWLNNNQTEKPWITDTLPNSNLGYPIISAESSSVKDEILSFAELSIYPNPASNFITLQPNVDMRFANRIVIRDLSGRICAEFLGFNANINIAEIPVGCYFVEIECCKAVYSGKFIKQ